MFLRFLLYKIFFEVLTNAGTGIRAAVAYRRYGRFRQPKMSTLPQSTPNHFCPHYPHCREPCISIRHRQGIGLQTSYLYNDICVATPVFRNTPFVNEKHFLSLRRPSGQLHIDESVFAFILGRNLANFICTRISNSFITLYGYSGTLLR